MKQKPGVMIYFELRTPLKMLTLEEMGSIFQAILAYGEDGQIDERELLGNAAIIWPFVRMALDRDDTRYQEVSLRNRYANYVRWQKERGEEILPRNEWEVRYHISKDDALE